MPGQVLNPRESRKRLLLVVCELDRTLLLDDLEGLRASLGHLGHRARAFRNIATAAALLVTGLSACGRGGAGARSRGPSWRGALVRGAGLLSSLWLASRGGRRSPSADR